VQRRKKHWWREEGEALVRGKDRKYKNISTTCNQISVLKSHMERFT